MRTIDPRNATGRRSRLPGSPGADPGGRQRHGLRRPDVDPRCRQPDHHRARLVPAGGRGGRRHLPHVLHRPQRHPRDRAAPHLGRRPRLVRLGRRAAVRDCRELGRRRRGRQLGPRRGRGLQDVVHGPRHDRAGEPDRLCHLPRRRGVDQARRQPGDERRRGRAVGLGAGAGSVGGPPGQHLPHVVRREPTTTPSTASATPPPPTAWRGPRTRPTRCWVWAPRTPGTTPRSTRRRSCTTAAPSTCGTRPATAPTTTPGRSATPPRATWTASPGSRTRTTPSSPWAPTPPGSAATRWTSTRSSGTGPRG